MRLAVVYPHPNLDTIPSLVATIEALARAGHHVTVFTLTGTEHTPARFAASDRIQVDTLGRDASADLDRATAGVRGLVKRSGWLRRVARGPLMRSYRALGLSLSHGSRLAARARGAMAPGARPVFDYAIGVDPDGLALAARIAPQATLVYFSLELLLSYEITSATDVALKNQERRLSRQAAFVIIQDAERARLLADDNGLRPDQIVLVPNAPPGPARRQPGRYWHDRFALASEKRVVLHSGSLGDWTGIEQIVASASAWPASWVLVVHTRYDAEASDYVDRLRRAADPQRVLFSLRPVPRQQYDALIDGADIGLAFYVPSATSSLTQRNVGTIGLSSGKLAYYVRSGLPVIVNRATALGDVLEGAGCGVAVPRAEDIGAALEWIGPRYAAYSDAACAFFNEHLDVDRALTGWINRLATMSGVA